jgi:predicted phage-related endonuclease
MGLNFHKNAYKQFMLDTGKVTDEPTSIGEKKMEAGKAMEEVIIQMYEKRSGNKVHHPDVQIQYRKGKLTGHMDGFVTFITEDKCPLEIKNTTLNLGSCAEDMDRNYYAQVQGYIYITDSEKAVFCYLRNGWDLCYFDVPRDDEFIEEMLLAIDWYEDCLEKGFFNEPVVEVESKEMPIDILLNVGLHEMSREFAQLKTQSKELEERQKELKQEITEILGDNYGKLNASDFTLAYRSQSRKGGLDEKALNEVVDVEHYRKEPSVFSVLDIRQKGDI